MLCDNYAVENNQHTLKAMTEALILLSCFLREHTIKTIEHKKRGKTILVAKIIHRSKCINQ